ADVDEGSLRDGGRDGSRREIALTAPERYLIWSFELRAPVGAGSRGLHQRDTPGYLHYWQSTPAASPWLARGAHRASYYIPARCRCDDQGGCSLVTSVMRRFHRRS